MEKSLKIFAASTAFFWFVTQKRYTLVVFFFVAYILSKIFPNGGMMDDVSQLQIVGAPLFRPSYVQRHGNVVVLTLHNTSKYEVTPKGQMTDPAPLWAACRLVGSPIEVVALPEDWVLDRKTMRPAYPQLQTNETLAIEFREITSFGGGVPAECRLGFSKDEAMHQFNLAATNDP